MKIKMPTSILVVLAVVLLSTGVAYASPFSDEECTLNINDQVNPALSSRFVLQDSEGHYWNLNVAFGCVLYGTLDVSSDVFPAYGYLFGDEMVLWVDAPGTGGWVDNVVYTGMWDFTEMTWTGYWVNYPPGSSGSISMWLSGAAPGAEIKTEPTSLIAGEARDAQDSGEMEAGVPTGEEAVNVAQNPQLLFGDASSDRGTICYDDSSGKVWDLDMAYGCILYGTVTKPGTYTWPAYGWRSGDEMFLWADGPGTGGYVENFARTGKWNTPTLFDAFWVNSGGNSGDVQMWPCGGGGIEYYAVISGNGYNCAYADDDAFDVYDVLVSSGNWDSSNIRLLVSTASGSQHDCTYTNIQNGIAWMASQADDDDVCVFWYSGHGGYTNDVAPLDESDGYDEYICPEGGDILDDELTTWMSAIAGYKLAGIDSCFSGGFIKDGNLTSRSKPGLPRALITDGLREDLCLSGFNVHTACDEDESAYGSSTLQNGVFTYFFVQGLYGPADSNSDGDVDAMEAHLYTRPLVQAYMGNKQNPWVCIGTSEPLIWVE